MLRLPLMLAGLGAAGTIIASTSGALGGVTNALANLSPAPNNGPLIIQIQRSTSLSQGASDVLKQTRCLLLWAPAGLNPRGQYTKQCSTSVLPR